MIKKSSLDGRTRPSENVGGSGGFDDIFGHLVGGRVDHLAVDADRPFAFFHGFGVGVDNAFGTLGGLGIGANTSLPIWEGWIAYLPSQPIMLAFSADSWKPSRSSMSA